MLYMYIIYNIYIKLNHFAVHMKLTHCKYCKPTILQNKNRTRKLKKKRKSACIWILALCAV